MLLPLAREDVDDAGLRAAYAYPGGTWLRANMVTSLDGAASSDGRSRPLSGPADRRVLRILRSLADVVVVGAGSLRAEGYDAVLPRETDPERRAASGQPPVPALAVVTRVLDLDLGSALFRGPAPTLVLTAEAAGAERLSAAGEVADVEVCGVEGVDVGRAFDALAARGHRRLLCEGGPSLLAAVAAAGRLDELCLTLSPQLRAGDAARVLTGPLLEPALPLQLGHLLEDEGYLFGRWVAAAR